MKANGHNGHHVAILRGAPLPDIIRPIERPRSRRDDVLRALVAVLNAKGGNVARRLAQSIGRDDAVEGTARRDRQELVRIARDFARNTQGFGEACRQATLECWVYDFSALRPRLPELDWIARKAAAIEAAKNLPPAEPEPQPEPEATPAWQAPPPPAEPASPLDVGE